MRFWKNNGQDDGSIHPIGNGSMLIYEQGPNIINMFGPPYSAPSFLQMLVYNPDIEIMTVSEREKGTAIWQHHIKFNGKAAGKIVDYLLPYRNIFFRDIESEDEIIFKFVSTDKINRKVIIDMFTTETGSYDTVLLTIPKGSTFFTNESVNNEINMLMTIVGDAITEMSTEGELYIRAGRGKCRLIFSAGSYPEAVTLTEEILSDKETCWIEKSRYYWNEFTSRRINFESLIPDNNQYKKAILDAIDSVSVLIKCQQSNSGGVSAGHYYPMAYVRDQAGVIRGLLALGYIDEARQIIEFWSRKWELFNGFCNADGMGNNSARLFFGNDEVEIPAYIILECFKYYEYTNDDDFIDRMFPMMESAFETQLKHLVDGMTEFSADETYIAGDVYPRYCMFHGSAESTLLFITGSQKLLEWAGKNKKWSTDKLEKYTCEVSYAYQQYKQNFISNGRLFANNPNREKIAGKPRFRYSFCDNHILRNEYVISWCEENVKGYYVCPECRNAEMPEFNHKEKRYILNSVSLVPMYIGSDIFTKDEIINIVAPIIDLYKSKRIVPSNEEGTRSLGYDYGLLLYNLIKLNHPVLEDVLQKTLSLLDSTGAWVEYYDNSKPYNCRARPWESAINIEAIIEYIKKLNTNGEYTAG